MKFTSNERRAPRGHCRRGERNAPPARERRRTVPKFRQPHSVRTL